MEFIVFIIILFFLLYVVEKGLTKWLGIEKMNVSETPGKNVNRWGKGILFVLFVFTYSFFISKGKNVMIWFWIIFLTLSMGFQSFVEWKYLKPSKQYIITLSFLVLTEISVFALYLLYLYKYWS